MFWQCPIFWPIRVENENTGFWLCCPTSIFLFLHIPSASQETSSHRDLNYLYPIVYKEILWSYYWEHNEFKNLFSLYMKPYFQDGWVLMDSKAGSCLKDLKLRNELFVLGGSFPSWSTKSHCFHGWRASEKQNFQDMDIHSKYIINMLSIPLKQLFP